MIQLLLPFILPFLISDLQPTGTDEYRVGIDLKSVAPITTWEPNPGRSSPQQQQQHTVHAYAPRPAVAQEIRQQYAYSNAPQQLHNTAPALPGPVPPIQEQKRQVHGTISAITAPREPVPAPLAQHHPEQFEDAEHGDQDNQHQFPGESLPERKMASMALGKNNDSAKSSGSSKSPSSAPLVPPPETLL